MTNTPNYNLPQYADEDVADLKRLNAGLAAIDTALPAEIAARIGGDAANAADLASEVARATAAEGVNAAAITALGTGSVFVCNLVTQYGADPTGVTESVTALQNAVNAAAQYAGGTAPTLTTTAGKRDIFKFRYVSGGVYVQTCAAVMAVNAG